MKRFAAVAVVCLSSVAALNADVMVFDRGLPTANLNNAAGADRGNVAWADYTTYDGKSWAYGDDFNLGGTGSFTITDLRVWIVGSGAEPGAPELSPPSQKFLRVFREARDFCGRAFWPAQHRRRAARAGRPGGLPTKTNM